MRAAARWVVRQANRDGGFTVYRRGGPSNADDTGGAIEALVAAGRRRTATVRRAVAFLRRDQHRDGGYALTTAAPTNAQSTAFAVLGLRRRRRQPRRASRAAAARRWTTCATCRPPTAASATPARSRQTPVWVTAQAALALLRRPLPVLPPAGARAGAHDRIAVGLPATPRVGAGSPGRCPRRDRLGD